MMIDDDIFNNILLDLTKKDISTLKKGLLVKAYLKEHHISEREFSKRFNISHSTVNDWITGRQLKKYYLQKAGSMGTVFSLTDRLYFLLSTTKYKPVDERTIKKLRELKDLLEGLI